MTYQGPPSYDPQQYPPPQQWGPPPQTPGPTHQAPSPGKWWNKTWVLVACVATAVIAVVAAVIVIAGGKGSNKAATTAAATTSASSTAASSTSAATSAAPLTSSIVTLPSPTTPVGPTLLKPGQPAQLTQASSGTTSGGDFMVVVNAIKVNQSTGNQYLAPKNGQFVVADVTITAMSGSVTVSSSVFSLTTPDLRVWDPSFVSYFDPSLHEGPLAAPQAVRGNLSFDVQAGPIKSINIIGRGGAILATWTP